VVDMPRLKERKECAGVFSCIVLGEFSVGHRCLPGIISEWRTTSQRPVSPWVLISCELFLSGLRPFPPLSRSYRFPRRSGNYHGIVFIFGLLCWHDFPSIQVNCGGEPPARTPWSPGCWLPCELFLSLQSFLLTF
jgi:hypothetical protein